jgi:hypothetical protein
MVGAKTMCISNNLIAMRWVHVVVPENNIYLQNDQVGDLEGKTNQSIHVRNATFLKKTTL